MMCRHCGLPVVWHGADETLRDGTTARRGFWWHYDLIFETECGIACAEGSTVAAPPLNWRHRLFTPHKLFRALRDERTARRFYGGKR